MLRYLLQLAAIQALLLLRPPAWSWLASNGTGNGTLTLLADTGT